MVRQRLLRPRFCAFSLFLALAGCSSKTATEPIWIGHVAPLVGPEKSIGEHAQQGIDLAVEEVNKEENRIAGRQVKVVRPRTRGDAGTLVPESVRLITIDKVVALLGGNDAGQAERMARAAQPYGVAVIAPSGLPASSRVENLFSVAATPASRGQALARFAAQELKTRQAAVFTDNGSANSALAAAFIQEFLKGTGQRGEELNYSSDADLAALIERLQKSKPDVILVARPASDVGKLRGKLQAANLTAPILFGGAETGITALQSDREASQGVYLATSFAADDVNAALQEFSKKYRERFDQDPDIHAALAYESAQLLFEAMRQAGNPNAGRIREDLARLEHFDSLSGPLAFSREQGVRRPVFIVQLEEGRLKTIKRCDPEEK